MQEFSLFDAADIIKEEYPRIREWYKGDYLPLEEWQKPRGRGTKTVLTLEDLYRLKIFQSTLRAGLARAASQAIVGYIHPSFNNRLPEDFDWSKHYLHIAKYEIFEPRPVKEGEKNRFVWLHHFSEEPSEFEHWNKIHKGYNKVLVMTMSLMLNNFKQIVDKRV